MIKNHKALLLLTVLCASSMNLKSIEEASTEQIHADKEKKIHAKIEKNKEYMVQYRKKYQQIIDGDTAINTEKKKDTL